jgi:hemerythrin-like domain-containing protein
MPATSKKRSTSGRKTTRRQTGTNNRSGIDAISLLTKDHGTVRQLLKRLESSTENGRGDSGELLRQIENELKIHTQIEEEIFYPAFRDAVESEDDQKLYYEAFEEHHVVDLVLPEIKSSRKNSDEFAAKAKVLKDLVEHHAEQEETQMFPKARRALGATALRDLGQRLKERKQELASGRRTSEGTINRVLRPFLGSGNKKRRAA